MTSFLQWLTSSAAKPKKYRIYCVYGDDACLRADAMDRIVTLTDPQERSYYYVGTGEGEVPGAHVWDSVETQPMPGISRRLVVVHSADKIRVWDPLKRFIAGSAMYPETTLVLLLKRSDLGKRVRNKAKSLPGAAVWETTYEDWEEALRAYSNAALISCSPLSIDPADRSKPSQAQRWLSLRLPLSQPQTEYLWRRVGGSSLLARDAVRGLRLAGVNDASGMAQAEFASWVDRVVGQHGAEELTELLLFERRAEAMASVIGQSFERADWSRTIGLLGQRLDWLSALHGALGTNEKLDQVMRRLAIPRHMILHYAHREDKRHNIARKYDDAKVKRCRLLLADLDSILNSGGSIPPGLGEVLVSSW